MLQDYSFPDSTFSLIADIDCEGRALPTGEFEGTFDGQGHVISNLCVEADGDEPAGLFGTISGTVRDVILVNPVVTGGDCVGALAGEIASDDARVSRCGVIGAAVTASGNYAGAFAGQIGGGAVVSECFAAGTVASADNSAGGFAGYVEEATISDCYAVANVSGKRYAGSFAGKVVGPDNATWIERCYAAGTAHGSQDAGGFAGALEDEPGLADCFAQDPDAATDGVTALDAAEMRASANFSSWPAVWTQDDGRTQPYFAWGLVGGKFILSGDDAIAGLGAYAPGTNAPVAIDPQDRVFLGWTGTATYADRDNATTTVLVDNHRNVAAELGTFITDRAGLEAIADNLAGTYLLVTFDPNGGTCNDPDRRYDIGTYYDFLPRPAWSGHAFLGWFDAADGGYPIPEDSRVTTDATRIFYAHWIDTRAYGLPIRALDIGSRTLRYDMDSQANMDAMFPGAGAVFCTVVTSTNLADKAWLAIGGSANWSANTAGEAGWIQVSGLDTTDPVRFWRIAATLYVLVEGDSVEFKSASPADPDDSSGMASEQ